MLFVPEKMKGQYMSRDYMFLHQRSLLSPECQAFPETLLLPLSIRKAMVTFIQTKTSVLPFLVLCFALV